MEVLTNGDDTTEPSYRSVSLLSGVSSSIISSPSLCFPLLLPSLLHSHCFSLLPFAPSPSPPPPPPPPPPHTHSADTTTSTTVIESSGKTQGCQLHRFTSQDSPDFWWIFLAAVILFDVCLLEILQVHHRALTCTSIGRLFTFITLPDPPHRCAVMRLARPRTFLVCVHLLMNNLLFFGF